MVMRITCVPRHTCACQTCVTCQTPMCRSHVTSQCVTRQTGASSALLADPTAVSVTFDTKLVLLLLLLLLLVMRHLIYLQALPIFTRVMRRCVRARAYVCVSLCLFACVYTSMWVFVCVCACACACSHHSHAQFAPLIKANVWLFRHRLQPQTLNHNPNHKP